MNKGACKGNLKLLGDPGWTGQLLIWDEGGPLSGLPAKVGGGAALKWVDGGVSSGRGGSGDDPVAFQVKGLSDCILSPDLGPAALFQKSSLTIPAQFSFIRGDSLTSYSHWSGGGVAWVYMAWVGVASSVSWLEGGGQLCWQDVGPKSQVLENQAGSAPALPSWTKPSPPYA